MIDRDVGRFTVAVFQDTAWATKGLDALKQAGFPSESLTILARDGADPAHFQTIRGSAQRACDERADIGALLRENRQRFGGKSGLPKRVEPLLRPRDILKDTDRKPSRFHVDHDV